MPRPGGGRRRKVEGGGRLGAGLVESKTCNRSSLNCASNLPSDWLSLCPAQVTSRMLRSTAGTMLLFRRRANVRVCSSGTDCAGGVFGGGGVPVENSKLDPADCWGVCVSVGEERDSWLTNASADLEKMKPRCWRALVTVWRAREGTRM
jgi:hypothetical protein